MGTELDADLNLLERMRHARAQLNEEICAASVDQSADVLNALRLESSYHLCEFFFLLKANGFYDTDDIHALADMHNRYLAEVLKDEEKMRRMNLTSERLLQAIFTGDTMPRLLDVWRSSRGSLDQSNLARFLVTIMSTETCRKLVVAFTKAGFLERIRTPHGTVVIRSKGIVEAMFGASIRQLRLELQPGMSA
ncbi:hypothetical protein [Bradyrhizobium uaiense]|uniref:Uncharacterized protein n=1 Tax=Bradyrhizobium uaiense TaxID=2594946 RepID=A0A6P1BAM9_9BRAD|nr:hypothetical protein [Bradyrhizobium uaiense]NEU94691.1 hypothetical protein [Bradyrhizobium uaiense]